MDQGNITIAIVDDEKIFRVLTRKKLEEVMEKIPFSFIMREFSSGLQFLNEKETFDIVFMDIAMPKLSGLDTAEKYREYNPDGILIFLTAYDEYMKEGYKVNAFRYLGKQDDSQEFFEAVKSAMLILQAKQKMRFQLLNSGEVFVSLDDIVYLESQTRSSLIHMKNNEILPIRNKISELTELLEKRGFYLVHRAYLINMRYARSCVAGEVIFSTLEKVPISERRSHEFRQILKEFHALEGKGI
ncbi:MAG: response regulator transcription factor [Lachnospiraceae bacterium]|nr:response regulator transcription factor [Lachnospiraceae bacterium]